MCSTNAEDALDLRTRRLRLAQPRRSTDGRPIRIDTFLTVHGNCHLLLTLGTLPAENMTVITVAVSAKVRKL